jgi:hypothetical protein
LALRCALILRHRTPEFAYRAFSEFEIPRKQEHLFRKSKDRRSDATGWTRFHPDREEQIPYKKMQTELHSVHGLERATDVIEEAIEEFTANLPHGSAANHDHKAEGFCEYLIYRSIDGQGEGCLG